MATNDTPPAIGGGNGGTTPSVLDNDTLNGNPVTPTTVTLTPGTSPQTGISMNPDGTVTVAPNTPAGTYTYPYTICDKVNPNNCSTASTIITVNPPAIVATNDTPPAIGGGNGGTTPSVLDNDTLNGNPVTPTTVTLTPGTSPQTGISMNPDGTVTVAPNTPAGTYTYPYTICDKVNPNNCSTATTTITVNPPAIVANNDTPPAIGGGNGGKTPSVLDNDTLNGQPVSPTTVTLTPGTSPQTGISMNPDGTVTVAPNTPAGTYTYPYTICDKVNPNNCSTASTTITVNPPAIVAGNDTPPAVGGGNGGTTPSVLDNDTLNGQPVSPTTVTLTPGTSPNAGLKMNPDGTVTVAPNTPAGTYTYPYTICDKVNLSNCSTASTTITVNPPAIVASNDTPPAINSGNGGTTPSVLINDTLNGQPVSTTTVTLTPGTSPNAGLKMNSDGTVTVAPNTPAGTYTYPYTICDKVNPNNCSTASTTITINPPAIVAGNDTPPAVGGGNGGTTPSVLDNDTLNGQPVSPTTVTLTPGTSPQTGISMNPDGTVTIAPNTPAGTYTYPYTICDKVNPNNCSTATTTITVNPPAIVATNDTPPAIGGGNGGKTPSVLDNDTLNGQPVSTTTVTLTPGTSPNAGLKMNPDGTVTVAPNTPAGTYTYPYTICDKVNPNNCSTSSTTITVNPPAIAATNDTPPAVGGGNGGKTPSVLDNDTLNGQPVTPTTVTLTLGTSPQAGISMNPDGTVTVAPNTPAGTYTYPYTICDKVNPNNCSTASTTITVNPPAIVASNDTPPAINSGNGGTTPSVLINDTLNGQPVSPTTVTLTPGTSPNAGLKMNPDGTVIVAPNTPAGTYTYPYTICDKVNPNNCSTASTTITVNSPAIVASNDTPPAINSGNGGTTPSVLINDTLNGQPVSPTTVTLTPGTSPNAGLKMNPDGTVTVAPNTPAGTYTYPYTICDKVNPNNCSTASAIITVNSPAIVASNDTPPAINSGNGGTTPSVLINDTLNGQPVSTTTVTLTPGTSPNAGLKMNPDGTVTVAPNTPAGTYTYPYTICDKANPNNCSSAIAIVTVEASNFHIPNLFTPNGDGNNDTFEIIGLEQFTQNNLIIVNRWGNEVYHAENYQNNWTGEGLNEGTYYYLLKVKKAGSSTWVIYKGYITLIRAFKK